MDTHAYTLIAKEGPARGQSFPIDRSVKLGRSSQSDIAIPDPELSRSHCCFELRDDGLWVVDLASANQTFVNGEAVEERRLSDGDLLAVGTSVLLVADAAAKQADETSGNGEIDLGFDRGDREPATPKKGALRPLLWSVAAILVLIAGATCILGRKDEGSAAPVQRDAEVPKTLQIRYEKVEADTNGIFRYELNLAADRTLSVKIDDLRENNRTPRPEAKKLDDAQLAELVGEVASSGFFSLEKSYTGFAKPGTMNTYSLFVSLGPKAHLCTVADKEQPPAFRALREKLETFSKNELGIWAIQFSTDKLVELAKEAQRIGAKKYAEQKVSEGNLSESIRAYRDAIYYLKTVDPKPDFYAEIVEGFETAEQELDKRYRDQRFLADRAINLQEWAAAARELRTLCALIPDRDDKRHKEAAQKLLDVESRLKNR